MEHKDKVLLLKVVAHLLLLPLLVVFLLCFLVGRLKLALDELLALLTWQIAKPYFRRPQPSLKARPGKERLKGRRE
jgi:hypothetical protein